MQPHQRRITSKAPYGHEHMQFKRKKSTDLKKRYSKPATCNFPEPEAGLPVHPASPTVKCGVGRKKQLDPYVNRSCIRATERSWHNGNRMKRLSALRGLANRLSVSSPILEHLPAGPARTGTGTARTRNHGFQRTPGPRMDRTCRASLQSNSTKAHPFGLSVFLCVSIRTPIIRGSERVTSPKENNHR